MNKFFGFILTFAIISCRKDDVAIETKKDYSFFLAQTDQTFQGKLDGVIFSWSYGWNQFQSIAGYENGNGLCDSTDPTRIVLFGLTSDDGGQSSFRIYSPRYNSSSETEFSKIFSLGKKKLGDFRSDFYLTINKDNKFYQTNSLDAANEIEILKMEEFTDYFGKKLRVWFRLDAKLSSCGCQINNAVLNDGLMIAEFYGYKKEQ